MRERLRDKKVKQLLSTMFLCTTVYTNLLLQLPNERLVLVK